MAYKVYGRYSKSNDSNINSQPTFSLMPNTDPDIETLSPEPNTKSYQKVVEASAVPIQQIKIPNNGIWLPF